MARSLCFNSTVIGMERESFKSRIGFLLVSAGCAIGIGNVWKYPYVCGANGGGIFVVFYLLFLIIMGIPVMTMELAVGRGSRQSMITAYGTLDEKHKGWQIHGWLCLIGNYMLMMYYTTVSGWMFCYFYRFLTGGFAPGMSADEVSAAFGDMLGSPLTLGLWMTVNVILGFVVCAGGIQNGVEKVTKVMMSALLVLMVVLGLHSLTLSGAAEGMKFYLLPSMERASEMGLGKVMTAAMNQAFFTLSLGIGSMEIFGSYMSKDNSLPGEAVRICALDTFVAIMAGIIIFPACFSFGVETGAGPGLIFVTLPNIFVNMAGGRFWGSLFFLFMMFASFSTVIAVFENITAFSMDKFGMSRKKSVITNGILLWVLSLPCVLGYNVWSHIHLIRGGDILDSEDFIVSNLLLPIGSLIFLLFCVTKWGWGFDNYMKEVNDGKGLKFSKGLKVYFQFILPILILILVWQGLR